MNVANGSKADGVVSRNLSTFERVLFYVLLGVLCARPLLSESFARVELGFLPDAPGTTPATTVWLDALLLTAATAALARGWGTWQRGSWALLGVTLLATAIGVSAYVAGNQRLALNAGFNLLIVVLATAGLVQLMRASWMPRLLLAAALATGGTLAVKCITQKTFEYADTLAYWEEHRDELAQRGVDLDDPTIVNFERRLRSGEATGYQANPNTTGGLLAMTLLAAVGLLAAAKSLRGTRADRWAVMSLIGGLCLLYGAGIYTTGSLGATAAVGAGLLVFGLIGLLRERIARHPLRFLGMLGVGYLIVIAVAAAWGMQRGTLPHPSLAFRWHYWSTAAEIVEEAPLTGVGRLNFADAYMRHKPPESTEEVKDPHNLWLTLLVELGPVGLVGAALIALGALGAAGRRLAPDAPRESPDGPRLTDVALAAVAVMLVHAVFWGEIVNRATLLLWAVQVAGVWLVLALLSARVVAEVPATADVSRWLVGGLIAAAAAALVHGLVDFVVLTPAGLSLLGVVLAVALRLDAPGAPATRPARLAPALVGLVLIVTHIALVTLPTMRSGFLLQRLKQFPFDPTNRYACQLLLDQGRAALDADPLDPAIARELARYALALGSNAQVDPGMRVDLLEQAREFAESARQRNPKSAATYAQLATIDEALEEAYLAAARMDDSVTALGDAVRNWQLAVERYPTDPRRRIAAGRAWFEWWQETGNREAARTAAEHLAAALRIDRTRLPEEVVRLRESELAEIRLYLGQLERAGFGVPSASAPAP